MHGNGLRFSVVIPTCNRSSYLHSCLRALAEMDYPRGGFEVIVVDDGSAQPPPGSAVEEWNSLDLRWIHLGENRGAAAARNQGAERARGQYLAFLDDDCLAAKDWLSHLSHALEGAADSAVGGKVVNGRPRNVYAGVNQAILDEVYRYYNTDAGDARFFATMNLAVPAESFRELGGFRPSFRASEDREFCARWLDHGLRLVYAPQALVVHDASPGCREFWNRHYRFGQGAYHFRKMHATTDSGRIALEPVGFYWSLVISPLSAIRGWRAILAPGLGCLSQIASAVGFWAAHRRDRAEGVDPAAPATTR